MLYRILLLVIFVIFVFALIFVSSVNSTNFDESANIAAGLSIWKYGCFDLYPVNPPLVKIIAAFPLLFYQPDIDWQTFENYLEYHCVGTRPEFDIGLSLAQRNPDHIQFYIFISRLFCIPFALLGAYFCWCWSVELYGNTAGICAIILWCTSPNILTWGSFVMSDMAATSLGLMFGYFFWHWIKRPNWSETFWAALAFGFVLLTKFTWIILFLLLPLLWLIGYYKNTHNRSWTIFQHQLTQLLCIILAGFFILNLGYGFEGAGKRLGEITFASKMLAGQDSIIDNPMNIGGNRFTDSLLSNIPIPLPINYLLGIDLQKMDFERGNPSYLNGNWSDHGWWYFLLNVHY
jgi:hypothetical protein